MSDRGKPAKDVDARRLDRPRGRSGYTVVDEHSDWPVALECIEVKPRTREVNP